MKPERLVGFVVILLAISAASPLAQRAGRSRGGQSSPRGEEAPTPPVFTGPVQPGTPGSAYRTRPTEVPGPVVGPRGRRLGYWWWNFAGVDVLDPPLRVVREAKPQVEAPRHVDAAAESSLIQPMPGLPGPPAPTGSSGTLSLAIEPDSAQVYVDGFYVGVAGALAGSAQGLSLSPGWHRLEFRSPGYTTAAVNITIEAGRSLPYRARLTPLTR
jgi:hypothetical protein